MSRTAHCLPTSAAASVVGGQPTGCPDDSNRRSTMTINNRTRSVPSHGGGGTRRHPRAWTAIIGAAVLTGLSGLLAAAPATAGPATGGDSAAPADVTAQQY